jgi:hypothetical protein
VLSHGVVLSFVNCIFHVSVATGFGSALESYLMLIQTLFIVSIVLRLVQVMVALPRQEGTIEFKSTGRAWEAVPIRPYFLWTRWLKRLMEMSIVYAGIHGTDPFYVVLETMVLFEYGTTSFLCRHEICVALNSKSDDLPRSLARDVFCRGEIAQPFSGSSCLPCV